MKIFCVHVPLIFKKCYFCVWKDIWNDFEVKTAWALYLFHHIISQPIRNPNCYRLFLCFLNLLLRLLTFNQLLLLFFMDSLFKYLKQIWCREYLWNKFWDSFNLNMLWHQFIFDQGMPFTFITIDNLWNNLLALNIKVKMGLTLENIIQEIIVHSNNSISILVFLNWCPYRY